MTRVETNQFFNTERLLRDQMDCFYKSKGWEYDRRGEGKSHDLILNGRLTEEKYRSGDYGDILIELIQDIETFGPGWFNTTKSEILLYIIAPRDTCSKFYYIDWLRFRTWFLKVWLASHLHPVTAVSNRGWGITLNLCVPIRDIPPEIIETYSIDIDTFDLIYPVKSAD